MITSAQANQNHRESITKRLDSSKWDFKMHNKKEFNKKFTPYCQGCFRTKSLQKSSLKSEKGLTFMHCYKCKISSHLYCYGMNTEFHKETLADGEVVNIFLCDKCHENPESEEEACPVCKLTEGGFKKCDDGTWVHLVCALFNDNYHISNFETLKIHKLPSSEKDQVERKRAKMPSCDHCGNTGVSNMVSCGGGNCHEMSHVYCILKSRANQKGKKSKSDEESPGSLWQFNLNINDENIEKKKRQKGLSQFQLDAKRITDFAERINKIFDDSNFTPKKGEDSVVKKKKGKGGRTNIPKVETPFPAQIVKKIKVKGIHIFDITEKEEEEGIIEHALAELKNSLSKRVTVRCAKHISPLKYCLCDIPPTTESDVSWIACDFCDNWYHTSCVGLNKTASQELPSYFCARCLEWAKIKMDCFEEQETIIKSKNGFPTTAYQFKKFIPRQSRFMHICDLICSGVMMEILIEKALTSPITYQEIRELIQDTFILPLDFTESIQNLCIKASQGMVLDEWIAHNDIASDVKFESLLISPGKEDEIQKGTLQLFEKILDIYHKECNVSSEISSQVENITAILRWQVRVVDILQGKIEHKVKFEELEALYSEFDGIASSYIARAQSEQKHEEEKDQMLIESSELNELAVNEKEQLNQMMNSCKEWVVEYDGFFKKSVEHLEKLNMNIENDLMNIEDEGLIKETQNGEVILSQVAEENVQNVINKYMEYQNNKIKMQDLDHLLEKADRYAVEFAQEKRRIIAEKAKYEDFREKILKLDTNHMTPEQLEDKIGENDATFLYLPEMKRLYDLLKDFKIFSTKYHSLIHRIEVSKEYYSQASKENLLKDERSLKVSIEEVHYLIEEARKLPLDLSMYILPLQERLNEANKLKDFLAQFMKQPLETENLVALKMQAFQLGFLTPEIILINDKIKVNEEIKERIERENTSEELEYQISLAERHMLDPSILKDLKLKSQKVDQMRQHSFIFMCKREFNETDLKKVYQLLEEVSKLNVNFDEKEFLMGIIKSFSWFFELFNLLSTISHPDYTGRDEGAHQLFENFDVSKIFKLNLGEDIAFCTQETTKETLLQYADNIFEKFKKLMQFGSKQTFSDSRLKELFDLYARMLWSLEVKRLRNSPSPIVPGTLIRLYHQGQANQQVDKLNEDYQWLNSTFNKYNNWVQVVADKIYLVDLEVLCEKSNIQENYNIVQQVLNTYASLNIEADFIYKAARKVGQVMEWQFQAENCFNLIENMNQVRYDSIEGLVELASERYLNLPDNFKYVQMFSTLYKNASQLIDENLELFKTIQNYESSQEVTAVQGPENSFSEAKSRFCVDVETGLFKMDFYVKSHWNSGEKYPYQKALAQANALKNSPVNHAKDFEKIKVHLDHYEAWYTKVGEIRRKYKVDEFLLSPDEFPAQTYIRKMQIINDIDDLKIESTNLMFFDEEKENELFIIEWSLAALLLISRQDLLTLIPSSIKPSGTLKTFNENNFVTWESLEECLRRYADKLTPELSQQVQKSYSYRILTEQILKAKAVLEILKDVRSQENVLGGEIKRINTKELSKDQNRDHLKSLSEIKQISREIEEELLININKEKVQLNEMMKRYDELMKQYENLEFQQPMAEKITLLSAESLFRDLLNLPIKYTQNEDKNLQKAFKEFQELEEDLNQVRKTQKDNVVEYALAVGISEKYKKSLIQNAEAEKIQKELEKGESLFKKIEIQDLKVTFDEAIKYYEQICHLKVDFGVRAEKKRLELWRKIAECIKNKEVLSKGARLITFDVLKELLADTYKVYQGEPTEEMGEMEDLVKKVEEKVQEIYDQTDAKALGKMDTIVGGLVTVKGELQSHSQKLAQSSSYQGPKIVSVVKNLLKTQQNIMTVSATKGRPGRRPNPSKMKQSMEVEKTALKRKESDDMTVSEPVVGRKSRKKSKEEEEDEEEENMEEKKKLLKTEKGGQEAQSGKEEVKQKVREKNITQLYQLLDQNKLIMIVINRDQIYREGASKIEGYSYKKFSDNVSQYNAHIKTSLQLLSKLKNFKQTCCSLGREGFTEEAISYLVDNIANLSFIEDSLLKLPSKSLSDYMNQRKADERQENLKELIATNASVANTAESGPIKANPVIEIPTLDLEPEIQPMQIEEEKKGSVRKPTPEKIRKMKASLFAKAQENPSVVRGEGNKENQMRPSQKESLGESQKVSSETHAKWERHDGNKNIYKIFEGEFLFDNKQFKANLLSMAGPEEYPQAPKIPYKKRIYATPKCESDEMEIYFDRVVSNPASDSKVKLIAGWFQMVDGDNSILEEIANTAKQDGKVFRAKYANETLNASIFALHIDEFKPEWGKKITFNKSYLSSIPTRELRPTSLIWIIKAKDYFPTEEEPPLEAHLVYEPVEPVVENKEVPDEMEIEKAKEEGEGEALKNIVEESEIKREEPEIIKGDVRSHQDTSFIGIDSQGRPKLVETGDFAVHEEEKKEMEIEGGNEQEQAQENGQGQGQVVLEDITEGVPNQEVNNFEM